MQNRKNTVGKHYFVVASQFFDDVNKIACPFYQDYQVLASPQSQIF